MLLTKNLLVIAIFTLTATLCVLMTIMGGVLNYTPVPIYDMWVSLTSFINIMDGDLGELWRQHFDHRILLTRLLFYIDFICFEGKGIFLIIVNYCLLLVIFVFLNRYLNEQLPQKSNVFAKTVLCLLMLTMVFSWIQQANLIWTFQSQFFLAQLLPLAAFYYLHKSHISKTRSSIYFLYACFCGVLSLASMANGVFALPLLLIMAWILRLTLQRILCLALLCILGITAYFYDYQFLEIDETLVNVLQQKPLSVVQYFFLYLGSPVYFLTGKFSYVFSQLAGVFLIGSTLFFAKNSLKFPIQSSLILALLTFIIYICCSAFTTAVFRVIWGIPQALESRYTTPTLFAWSSLLILYAPLLSKKINTNSTSYLSALFGLQLIFFIQELSATQPRQDKLFSYLVAALAIELNIEDDQQIIGVLPQANALRNKLKLNVAIEHDLGIFGHPQLKDAWKVIGQNEFPNTSETCIGNIENYSRINDKRFVRITGWLFSRQDNSTPRTIHILNNQNLVVGYAITGLTRDDVATSVGSEGRQSGFMGYLLADYVGADVLIKGIQPSCKLNAYINLSALDHYELRLSSLAIKLGIKDDERFSLLPNQKNLTYPQLNLGDNSLSIQSPNNCQIIINRFEDIVDDTNFVRLEGKVMYSQPTDSELLRIIDPQKINIGYLLSGKPITDKIITDNLPVKNSTFKGYFKRDYLDKPISIQGLNSNCKVNTTIASHPPFKIKKLTNLTAKNLLSYKAIIGTNEWIGSYMPKTDVQGFYTWTSLIHSSKDTGSITLRMQRGAAFFYRSGPTGGNQTLLIHDYPFSLPIAEDWVLLEFSEPTFPETFPLKLIDNGTNSGEWSAIGLSN